jgi:hypothetical protein
VEERRKSVFDSLLPSEELCFDKELEVVIKGASLAKIVDLICFEDGRGMLL